MSRSGYMFLKYCLLPWESSGCTHTSQNYLCRILNSLLLPPTCVIKRRNIPTWPQTSQGTAVSQRKCNVSVLSCPADRTELSYAGTQSVEKNPSAQENTEVAGDALRLLQKFGSGTFRPPRPAIRAVHSLPRTAGARQLQRCGKSARRCS